MARIEMSQMVDAPTGVVFEYADTHENYPRFLPNATDLEWSTPAHEPGCKLRMKMKSAGIAMLIEFQTTEVVPDAKIAGIFTEGVTGSWEWRFEPVGDSTRMVYRTDYELPMGVLGQIADAAVVERDNRASIAHMMQTIKDDVEAKRRAA